MPLNPNPLALMFAMTLGLMSLLYAHVRSRREWRPPEAPDRERP